MRDLFKVLVLALCGVLLAPMAAQADVLNWSWTAPTARADGTPFDMSAEGAGYYVKFNGVQEMQADGVTPLLLSVGANNLSKTFASGNVCISLATVDSAGRVGTWSPPDNDPAVPRTACKATMAAPGEVSNITVTITVE